MTLHRSARGLRLADLEAFVEVADRKSFVRAARALKMTPSSLTRALQGLEEAVGQQLLNRSHRSVSLSHGGELFYTHAKQMLQGFADASDALSTLERGTEAALRFSVPEVFKTLILPACIADFAEEFPRVQLDIVYTDETLDPVEHGLDFGIRGAFARDSELRAMTLWPYERWLCASPEYLRRHGTPRSAVDLSEHRMLLHTAPRILRDWYLTDGDRLERLRVQPSCRVTSGLALLELARAGAGIARLADWVARPLMARRQLVRLLAPLHVTTAARETPTLHAVYAARSLPRAARLLLSRLKAAQEP